MIDILKQHAPTIVVIAALLALIGFLSLNMNEQTAQTIPKIDIVEQDKPTPIEAVKPYDFISEPGDSYTLLARKAIQIYATASKLTLSPARIIAAETTLTQNAGAPLLEVGQKVSLKTSDIETAVRTARALSADQLAAWEAYVPYVQL